MQMVYASYLLGISYIQNDHYILNEQMKEGRLSALQSHVRIHANFTSSHYES